MNFADVFKKLKQRILTPPQHLLQESKSQKAQLAADWRYLLLLDLLIWAFLLPSISHLAFIFGWGEPGVVNYIQALAFDYGIWFFIRSISRRLVDNYKIKLQFSKASGKLLKSLEKPKNDWLVLSVLWGCLMILVVISTSLNVLYELWDTNFQMRESFVTLYARTSGSGMLVIMVVLLSFVRALQEKSMIMNFHTMRQAEKEEAEINEKRKKQREYARRNREKMKNQPVTRNNPRTTKKRGKRR